MPRFVPDPSPPPLAVGDIVAVGASEGSWSAGTAPERVADAGPRYYVVLSTTAGAADATRPEVRVAAASAEVALAADRDCILSAADVVPLGDTPTRAGAGRSAAPPAPWAAGPWMVELWNTWPASAAGLGWPVARLEAEAWARVARAVAALGARSPLPSDVASGTPLAGRGDPRAEFQRREVRAAAEVARTALARAGLDRSSAEAQGGVEAAPGGPEADAWDLAAAVKPPVAVPAVGASHSEPTEWPDDAVTTADQWTNSSVLLFAGAEDPVTVMTARARQVVLEALDAGWAGPPFDPIGLADMRGIDVVAKASVADARTVSAPKGPTIEFNPHRSPGRRRFSIAHEIAHTLFPDYADQIRYRAPHSALDGDAWQLEALCNIGAAELLMPSVRIPALGAAEDLAIARLLHLRSQFDVSTEALLIRVARLSGVPCAFFCASPRPTPSAPAGATWETSPPPAYRLDYAVPGAGWAVRFPRRLTLPGDSLVGLCRAIGDTAVGDEDWGLGAPLHVECVGIPPYPGSSVPRVVGLVTAPAVDAPVGCVREVVGDATQPHGTGTRVIVHLVNDRTPNWGPQGFASALRRRFAAVQDDFRDWAAHRGRLQLGDVRIAHAGGDVHVATIVAQRNYGAHAGARRLKYGALEGGLGVVARWAADRGASTHMPRIGTGQAGGSWDVVRDVIGATLCAAGVPVTVYDLPGAPRPVAADQGALGLGWLGPGVPQVAAR